MKVLFIAPRFHTNLYYRVKALQKQGHQVKIVTLYQGKSEFCEDVNCELIGYSKLYNFLLKYLSKFKKNYLKSKFELRWDIPNIKALKRIIREFNPDLTLLKAYQDILALSVLFLLKRYNKKSIILVQTSKDYIKGSKILLRLYLKILKFLNVIHFISPIKITKKVFNNLEIKECTYIPFVINISNFRKKYFRNKMINIISVAKFVKSSNQFILLKIINNLKDKYNLCLTLVGEKVDHDYIKKIEDYINKNNLKKIINLKFNLDYEEMSKEYRNSDLFVLPGKSAAAYSIVEAMANKLPVICSDSCGTKCYIKEGKNGYIFKSKDLNNLVKQIEKIIKNKKNIIGMGKESFRYVQKNHSLKVFNNNFHKAIKKFVLEDD